MASENNATARGRALPISVKHSVNICAAIRGMSVTKAKAYLERVLAMKEAIPFKRYYHNLGHRPGMGPGRYPIFATTQILALIESAEKNAVNKGLSVSNLYITTIIANKGPKRPKTARRTAKRAHIEIVVSEQTTEKKQ